MIKFIKQILCNHHYKVPIFLSDNLYIKIDKQTIFCLKCTRYMIIEPIYQDITEILKNATSQRNESQNP